MTIPIRAVVFDVYGTLLEVGPPPADADARWDALCRDLLGAPPRLDRKEFDAACQQVVAAHHATARARGIPFPEVLWPDVVAEVLPELARLAPSVREEFVIRQIQTGRTTTLSPEAPAALKELIRKGCLVGIASNAQAYTLRELGNALAGSGLDLDLFERELRFWSFEHGFGKPDPHVYRILATRLAARGIAPHETLMIGDRLDNDIEPARRQAWQTWHLRPSAGGPDGGDWSALKSWLARSDGPST